jgi:hypothetical protein
MKYGCFNRWGLFGVAATLALAGCAATGSSSSASGGSSALTDGVTLPDLQPNVPPTTLRMATTGAVVQLPEPVVIPAEVIQAGYPAWAKAGYPGDWSIRLPDGRVAVLAAGRCATKEGLRLAVPQVSIYRADGTLAMEQFNTDLPAPSPNHPKIWTTYDADGKTQVLSVSYLPCADGRTIHWDVTHDQGKIALQNLTAVDGVITYERDTDARGRVTERLVAAGP